MNKQDRGGVRTAQDLERKYNLAGVVKAVKLHEEGINKTNYILESFINSTLKSGSNMQSQTDGQITTWFANGEPTIANEPMVYWETDEQKAQHIGDLYYDRDTGYAYEFALEDDSYKWAIITDTETIEALAIANSGYDTKDNQRRVFVEVPYPPYENGDLWLDGTDIYICQISKGAINGETGEAEVYAEGDFILATNYTDNTIANQVGEELKVLEGTVLTVIESADRFKAEVYDRDEKTRAELELVKGSLITLIEDEDGNSIMKQTGSGWEFSISDLISTLGQVSEDVSTLDGVTSETKNNLEQVTKALESVQKVTAYFNFEEIDGEPHLSLGTTKNGFKAVYTNQGLHLLAGNSLEEPHTYVDYDTLNIQRAILHKDMQVGGFLLKSRANRNAGFTWRGADE